MSETPVLFQFQQLVAVALVRKKITAPQASIAMLVALTSKGTTGERATIDEARLATETGLSTRQVWRHVKALKDTGWFEQTATPTRGDAGERGRRARYRLTLPALDLSLDNRLTPPPADVSNDDPETAPKHAESSDALGGNRLTLSAESSDIAERESGTVTPSCGTPSCGTPSGHPCMTTTEHARQAAS